MAPVMFGVGSFQIYQSTNALSLTSDKINLMDEIDSDLHKLWCRKKSGDLNIIGE